MRIVSLFAVFVIILFCAQPVQAQINKDYSFSLSPQFGFFYGHVEEIVYPTDTKADLLSLLLWDMKPVFYYGLLMDFSPVRPMERDDFFLVLSMKYGIPGPSGIMEDRDWLSKYNTELTNFSSHDNITKEVFQLDFSAGYSFPFFKVLLVKTFVNISYMNFRFYGENGYGIYARETPRFSGIYAPIDDTPDKYTFDGKVINYSQEWVYAAPGISLGYGYKNLFLAEISFIITPLVSCLDLDEHLLTNTQFRDSMAGGIMLEPGFQFSLSVSKWLGISFDISWRYISGTKGLTHIRPIGIGNYRQEGEAGAGMSILNTALSLKVKL
jgi:outer membrane protease